MTISKEKLKKMQTNLTKLVNLLEAPLPEKHKDHPESYRNFLRKDIHQVKSAIDAAKLEGTGK